MILLTRVYSIFYYFNELFLRIESQVAASFTYGSCAALFINGLRGASKIGVVVLEL